MGDARRFGRLGHLCAALHHCKFHAVSSMQEPSTWIHSAASNVQEKANVVVQLQYTVKTVYPIFAMVEDENPPAYEPVPLADEIHDDEQGNGTASFRPTNGQPKTVTSSLRAINRLLMANGGIRANFRGFFCALAQGFLTSILLGIFTGAFGGFFVPVATLLAALVLCQLSTAWVHIIISERSPRHFWSRLPPFRRTFDATYKAVTLLWLATEVSRFIPLAMALALGLEIPRPDSDGVVDFNGVDGAWIAKSIVTLFVGIVCAVFIIIPATVIVVRIKASLLPVEDSPIIPFDRSFEGKVEPEVVGGKGYATISDAWSTFSKTAWRRLLVLYAKVFLVVLAGMGVCMAVLIPEAIIISKHAKPIE